MIACRKPLVARRAPLIARGTALIALGAVALALAAGCGGHDAPPVPIIHAEPETIFAGRPLEIPALLCVAALLLEPVSNTVLYEYNADVRRAPASIVKMTLELVALKEIEAGRLSLDDSVRASAWASQIGGSQVYLSEGEVFTVRDLLQAIAINSANDACVALAEHLAGATDGFVMMMNQEVEALGLKDTHYVNVHGLDDTPGEGNYTTARDIAQIGREVVRHPLALEWASTPTAPFRGGKFILHNTNHLVGRFPGLDGIKTGHTDKAGFCLCASAERQGLRLISVVLGAHSNKERFDDTARLLSSGFSTYLTVPICRKGEAAEQEVRLKNARPEAIRPVAPRDVTLIVSRPDDRRIEREFVPAENLQAPMAAGSLIGNLRIKSGEKLLAEIPMVSAEDVKATGFGAWLRRIF